MTSEHAFDLLQTDGGEIQILDCATIIKMVPMRTTLVIFATNGVWGISGSQGIGFTATDFSVNKISSVPCISKDSFVDVGGMPIWWNYDGIYTVKAGDIEGFSIVSLSENKIKTFFDAIPTESKRYARGTFDDVEKVVYWTYRSTTSTISKDVFDFDSVLCFNAVKQAFYPWDISGSQANDIYVNGVVAIRGQGTYESTGIIYDSSGDVVTDDSIVEVTGTVFEQRELASVPKFLTTYSSGGVYYVTFSEASDSRYVDFYTFDSAGVDYESYFTSGYRVRGDGQRKFQANYVYVFSDNLMNNRYHFQTVWDYGTDADFGDYSSKQLITTTAGGWRYKANRLRLRGSGLAVQYRVTSISGQPFNIIGWSTFNTGNTAVG